MEEEVICSKEECTKPAGPHGLCNGHWRTRKDKQSTCLVDGCERDDLLGWGWCKKHYTAWHTYGDPLIQKQNKNWLRDEFGRECYTCGVYQPWENYQRANRGNWGHVGECKSCKNGRQRDKHNKYTYNLTKREYEGMLRRQGNQCDACGGEFGSRRDICVDHDHNCCPGERSCGECVRALLCQDCNISLGRMKECPKRIRALASYVERHLAA